MLEVNLLVPREKSSEIYDAEDDDFEIVHKASSKEMNFYVIRTTEEKLTYLTLRYGTNAVWKR